MMGEVSTGKKTVMPVIRVLIYFITSGVRSVIKCEYPITSVIGYHLYLSSHFGAPPPLISNSILKGFL